MNVLKQMGSLKATTLPGIKAPLEKLYCLSHLLYVIVLLVLNKTISLMICKNFVCCRCEAGQFWTVIFSARAQSLEPNRPNRVKRQLPPAEVWDMKLPNILNIWGTFPDWYNLCNASTDCGRPQPPESGSCLMVLQIIKNPLFACFQSLPQFEYPLLRHFQLLFSF